MSEVKHIMEVFAEMAKTDNSPEAEALRNCPSLQIELLRQGLISLDDLEPAQVDRLMDIVFQEEWMPIDYKLRQGYPKAERLLKAIVEGHIAITRYEGRLYGRISDLKTHDLLAEIDYSDYNIQR